MVNALELSEELQARTDFSERDARGIVYAISRAIETATAKLVTSEQLDARVAELRADMAELRSELKIEMAGLRGEMAELRSEVRRENDALRVEMRQALRSQTIWLASTMIAVAGLMVAAIKLIP